MSVHKDRKEKEEDKDPEVSVFREDESAPVFSLDADPAGPSDEFTKLLAEKLRFHLGELKALSIDDLLAARYQKFRNIAQFYTT